MAYPEFEAPEWETGRISTLRQQLAAPQVGRLRRQMAPWMIGGGGPQRGQEVRGAMRGFGEGLGGIMGAAGQTALSQYGQEYGREFEAAGLQFGAEMEEERGRLAREEAERERIWGTGERIGGEEFISEQAEEEREWRERWDPGLLEERRPGTSGRRIAIPSDWGGGFNRARGGRVVPTYKVGERGPELVAYDNGRTEVVGQQGPEARTFREPGQVIPADKTRAIMARSMQINLDPPPPLSEEEQVAFDRAMQEYRKTYPQDFGVVPKNREAERESLLIKRQRGGRVRPAQATPMTDPIMRYLMSTRMDPTGAAHMPRWQFMLQAQPQKLAGLLSYLQDGRQQRRR